MLVDRLKEHMVKMPIVAILRGVTPSEVEDVAAALIENGVGIIEVPLNSPSAFESIEKLADRFGEVAIIGAGTVLTVSDAVPTKSARRFMSIPLPRCAVMRR